MFFVLFSILLCPFQFSHLVLHLCSSFLILVYFIFVHTSNRVSHIVLTNVQNSKMCYDGIMRQRIRKPSSLVLNHV